MQTQTHAIVDFEAYRWPPLLDEPPPLPDWLKSALLIGDLRVSDDLGHIRTPEGELTIKPGDWVVKTSNGLFAVWSDDLYHAFMNSADAPIGIATGNAPILDCDNDADIAAARRLYGDDMSKWPGWDDNRIHDPDPHNAQSEGADTPDEPVPDASDPKATA
jgi:hypothetical protein